MRDNKDYLRFLSANMLQMVGVIGLDNTLLIMKRYGGLNLDVVVGKRDSSTKREIIDLIGKESATLLTRDFSRDRIYIQILSAVKTKLMRYERNKEINSRFNELVKKNPSYRHALKILSSEFNITDRQIYKIINRI
ncbi:MULTISPECIES: hypothetical protein [unclassified Serratia (in: enterobacteria)]|uniref:hypothetical protein n=1 Tax=unclassified Serratia (in: enterobacteria) TaxID=2647522 RepID=UPI003076810B